MTTKANPPAIDDATEWQLIRGVMGPMLERLLTRKMDDGSRAAIDGVASLYREGADRNDLRWTERGRSAYAATATATYYAADATYYAADAANAAAYAAGAAAAAAANAAAANAAAYAADAAAGSRADERRAQAADLIAACKAARINLGRADLDGELLRSSARLDRLDMRSWHDGCGTTHCRAGWYVHLTGPVGYALEAIFGPEVVGYAVSLASYPDDPLPDFFATHEDAAADIRRRAAVAEHRATLDAMEAAGPPTA